MKVSQIILPNHKRLLEKLGSDIRLARLRRSLTAEQVSQRAVINRLTLARIESCSASVAIGSYLQVLVVLGLEADLANVAENDELGRTLQDLGLSARKRAPSRKKMSK